MTELKRIYISFSLTLLLSLAVESLNIDQKWAAGNQFGYEGGFCLPGLCIGGSGGSRVHSGRDNYGGGIPYSGGGMNRIRFRQTMYCKPLNCWGGSCDALHLQLDKGLYESIISKNAAKHPSTVDYIPETMFILHASCFSTAQVRLKSAKTPSYRHCKRNVTPEVQRLPSPLYSITDEDLLSRDRRIAERLNIDQLKFGISPRRVPTAGHGEDRYGHGNKRSPIALCIRIPGFYPTRIGLVE